MNLKGGDSFFLHSIYIYTESVSKMTPKMSIALTLCYNEQTPNPFRWVWLALVLANVKIKSSWLALYIWVWGSQKKSEAIFQHRSDTTFRVRNQPRKRSSSGNISVALNKVRPR